MTAVRPATVISPAPDIPQPGGPSVDGLEIISELGRGAENVVYRARRGDREYALKLQREARAGDDTAVRAFRREAAILAQLRHDGLVEIHAVGESEGRPYLVMELLLGETLEAALSGSEAPLPERRVVALARDCAGALAAAHRAGLVHRDVKPENIVLTDHGRAKLIDFGLATTAGHRQRQDVAVGTLLYSPPEQTGLLKRPVDGRSDLYALGVVLFEALAGAPPFQAGDVGELVRLHAVAPPPDLRDLVPGISPALAGIVARLLAKDPDDRYQTGEGLLADLDRLAGHEGGAPADFPLGLTDDPGGIAYDLPLVGREAELDELRGRWRRAADGTGSVVLVEGPPGGGKSRLVRELLAEIRQEGGLVLAGKVARGNPVPLASLRDAVEAHLRRIAHLPPPEREAAEELVRYAARAAAGLAAAFSPLLGELVGEAAGADEDGERQEQYFAAVAAFLCELARAHGSASLWIDDVQWIDPASRRVLELAALQLGSAPLLLLATSRDDEDSTTALQRFAEQLGDTVRARITLGPLDAGAIGELVEAQLGGALEDDRFAAQIATRSGGSPLAAVEYVRAVLHAGLVRPSWGAVHVDEEGLERIALPDDVIGLVLDRVDELGDDARRLLTAAAAMGTRFRPDVLAGVLGGDESTVAAAIGEALRERLIERIDQRECAFVHDRIREALLGPLSEAEAQALHQRIAEALEEAGGDEPDHTFAVARHYGMGVPGRTPEQVFAWNARAGEAALARYAAAEAAQFFACADEAAAALGIDPDARYHETAGAIAMALGEVETARAAYARALERSGDAVQRARVHRQLARAANAEYDSKTAIDESGAGLRALGRRLPRSGPLGALGALRDVLACILLVLRGALRSARVPGGDRDRLASEVRLYQEAEYAAFMQIRSLSMLAISLRGLARALRLGPSAELSYTLVNTSVVVASLRWRWLNERMLRRGLAMAEQTGDPQAIAHAHLFVFHAAEILGDTREAGEIADRVLSEHGRWLDLLDLLSGVSAISFNFVLRGRILQARDAWMPVYRRMRNVQAAGVAESPYLNYGAVTFEALGARAEAAELFDICRRTAERTDEANRFALLFFHAAALRYHQEQAEVGPRVDPYIEGMDALGLNPLTAPVWSQLFFVLPAEVLVARARAVTGTAREAAVADARRRLRKVRFARFHPIISALRTVTDAELTRLEGRPKRALALAARAERLAVRCDAPLMHLDVARVRARAFADLGEPAEARRQAVIAARLAGDEGMVSVAAEIAAELGVEAGEVTRGSSPGSEGSVSASRREHPSVAGMSHSGGSIHVKRSLDALLELSLVAARTHDHRELVAVALDQLGSLLGAERAFLFLRDEGGALTLEGARGADGADLADPTGYAHTIVRRVSADRRAIVVTGTEEAAALGSESAVHHGLRSILAAPLVLEERLLGVVYLDSRLARGIFTEDDLEILSAISGHIAVSLETARAAELEATVAAEREQRGLAETLRDSMTVISARLDPAEVVRSTLEMAGRTIAFDRAAILLSDRGEWRVAAVAGDLDAAMAGPCAGDPADAVLTADGEGRVMPDVGGGAAPLPDILGDARSWLSAPLAARGERVGVLVMACDARDALGPAQLELAATFAGQGVVAYENARLFEAVERMATTDELTGVNNRRHFFDLGEKQFATSRRYGPQMSAMMIDIDHFKQVNDRYGHAAGDDVIRRVARRLGELIRPMDVMGRYGGEEFAFILPETGEAAAVLAERLRAAIEAEPIETREGDIPVTISVGVALMDDGDAELADTLDRADAALYEAKRSGRNRVVSAPPSGPRIQAA